jgi:DNA-binding MarR family transcriptional regulator
MLEQEWCYNIKLGDGVFMVLKEELKIGKPLSADVELLIALMFTRERVVKLFDAQLFGPAGITEPQFNVLRILKGGPEVGYPIREIKARMITPNADVPRLVDRMQAQGWVRRDVHPEDARSSRVCITAIGLGLIDKIGPGMDSLSRQLAKSLSAAERKQCLFLLERLRRAVDELE